MIEPTFPSKGSFGSRYLLFHPVRDMPASLQPPTQRHMRNLVLILSDLPFESPNIFRIPGNVESDFSRASFNFLYVVMNSSDSLFRKILRSAKVNPPILCIYGFRPPRGGQPEIRSLSNFHCFRSLCTSRTSNAIRYRFRSP